MTPLLALVPDDPSSLLHTNLSPVLKLVVGLQNARRNEVRSSKAGKVLCFVAQRISLYGTRSEDDRIRDQSGSVSHNSSLCQVEVCRSAWQEECQEQNEVSGRKLCQYVPAPGIAA